MNALIYQLNNNEAWPEAAADLVFGGGLAEEEEDEERGYLSR